MRLLNVHINGFGGLSDVTLEDIDAPIVVVEGHNEAGKSSLFHFLASMLYGFYPATAENHEYQPWDGRRLEGTLQYSDSQGEEYTIYRRLLSAPKGELSNGTVEDLRNRTLPVARHISKDVFEAVYAVSHLELTSLEEKAWDEVQDRLLGGLQIDHIRPAREVLDELDQDASALWRPDRRGKPRAQALKAIINDLREAVEEAQETDRQVRALKSDIHEAQSELEKFKNKLITCNGTLRKVQRLRPVKARLDRIRTLDQEAGTIDDYDYLPADPHEALSELTTALSETEKELEQNAADQKRAQEKIDALTEQDEDVLACSQDIQTWAKQASGHHELEAQYQRALQQFEHDDAALVEEASHVFIEPIDESAREELLALSPAALREALRRYKGARDRYQDVRTKDLALEEQLSGKAQIGLAAGLVILSMGVAVGGFLLEAFVLLVLGGAGTLAGIGWGIYLWRHQQNIAARREELGLGTLWHAVDTQRETVATLLADLPLPKERINDPDDALFHELSTLRNKVVGLSRLQEDVDTMQSQVDENLQQVNTLAAECHAPQRNTLTATVTLLEETLTAAAERDAAAEQSRAELENLRPEGKTLEQEKEAISAQLAAMKNALETLGAGTVEAGISRLAARRKARRDSQTLDETLRQEYPELDVLQQEIDELSDEDDRWVYTDEEIARLEHEQEELTAVIDEKNGELADLNKEWGALKDHVSADLLMGRLTYYQEELDALRKKRDALALLRRITHKADRNFRMEHQPDVIQRASQYVRTISGGRYDRLLLHEGSQQLRVMHADNGRARAVNAPLSQGTRDQIYLALRLAIVDHLDDGKERLPLFLDEALITWDATRRRQGWTLMQELAKKRQLFLFTCHDWLADEVDQLPESCRVTLEME